MSMKSLLLVPTNEEYSFAEDPDEQLSYVNPVTLNNLLIKYANAAVEVTSKIVVLKKAKVELDITIRELKQDIADLESDILQENEGSANDHKNLKAQAAFVRKKAKETGRFDTLAELEQRLEAAEIERMKKQLAIENASSTLDLIDQLSQNVQTHLSFVKNEMRHTGRYN